MVNGEMRLSRFGKIVYYAWLDLPKHYPYVILDEFCIMPNHVHFVIVLDDDGRNGSRRLSQVALPASTPLNKTHLPARETHLYGHPNPRHPLSEVIRAFKSFSAKRINTMQKTTGSPFWQKNYYEHIIRNDREWNAIDWYLLNNPLHWQLDRDNLQNKFPPPQKIEEYILDIENLTEKF